MKKFTLIISLLIFTLFTYSQKLNGPFGSTFDKLTGKYLVTNSNGHNIQQVESNLTYSLFSKSTDTFWFPGGIAYDNAGYVYVADWGKIKKLSAATGALLDSIPVVSMAMGQLIGLAYDGTTFLYATDYVQGNIYKVNVNTKAVTTIVTGIPYPISIFYEGSKNRLLVGTFTYSAEILYVDLLNNDSCKTLRNTSFGGISGIVADNKGNYFISQWIDGTVYKFTDPSFLGLPTALKSSLSNPIGIFYNLSNDIIAVPENGADTVIFLDATKNIQPPSVDTAYAISYTKVRIIFDEACNTSAILTTPIKYTGLPGTYTATMNSLGDTVTLTLSSSLVPNKGYLLQINYVQDLAGTPMVDPQTFPVRYPGNGIDNGLEKIAGLNIFPNPVINDLNINYTITGTSDVQFRLYDMSGKNIYTSEVMKQQPGKYNSTINQGFFNNKSGLFILEVSINGQTDHILVEVGK